MQKLQTKIMSYFNYHAKAKKLINEGHCIFAKITEKYNKISPALVLYFDNNPPMPIREYRWGEYFALLKSHGITMTE